MPDVEPIIAMFFDLSADGRASMDDLDDFVGFWQQAGDVEMRPSSDYVGMRAEEYGLWVIDHRMLPPMVGARRGGASLDDRAASHTLSYWVPRHGP